MAQQTGFPIGATARTMYLRGQVISTGLPYTAGVWNSGNPTVGYVRNKEAVVAITLATQTAGGVWASGGFVHIGHGLYRVDVPNLAFASATDNVQLAASGLADVFWSSSSADVGADDFRVAGFTLADLAGAVLNATLASYNTANTVGERLNVLSLAGIAGAVWNALTASYVTANTFGKKLGDVVIAPTATAIRDALLTWQPVTGYSLARLFKIQMAVFRGTRSSTGTAVPTTTVSETFTDPSGVGNLVATFTPANGNRATVGDSFTNDP